MSSHAASTTSSAARAVLSRVQLRGSVGPAWPASLTCAPTQLPSRGAAAARRRHGAAQSATIRSS